MLFFLLIFLTCVNSNRQMPDASEPTMPSDTLYNLDLDHATVYQSLHALNLDLALIKFVEIEIASVKNPKVYPLSFSVYYIPDQGESHLLGVFGLFPADNPGIFLVPTKGMLRSSGQLKLTMDRPEDFQTGDELTVQAREMQMRRE